MVLKKNSVRYQNDKELSSLSDCHQRNLKYHILHVNNRKMKNWKRTMFLDQMRNPCVFQFLAGL